MTTLDRKLLRLPLSTRDKVLRLTYAPAADAMWALTPEPEACTSCGEPHHLFVNRNGSTRCWECDESPRRPSAAARRRAAVGLRR